MNLRRAVLLSLLVLCAPLALGTGIAPDPRTATSPAGGTDHPGDALGPYMDFLDGNHRDPVDYVVGLFDDHDLVILCERAHPEATQYELILEIVRDPRFTRRIGHVFTEVGLRNLQPPLDELMATPGLGEVEFRKRLIPIYRDISIHPLWNRLNFFEFLVSVYRENRGLEPERRIEVVFSDVALRWDETDAGDYEAFRREVIPERDRRMADLIIEEFRTLRETGDPRPKAFVVMNYRHAFNDFRFDDGERGDNVGRYLFEAFPGRVANVMLNSLAIRAGSTDESVIFAPIQEGRWDAAFRKAGISDAGFELTGSPFGDDQFDYYPFRTETVTYEQVFTGFVFFRHLPEHVFLEGVPDLVDEAFLPELRRRYRVVGREVAEGELWKLVGQEPATGTYDDLPALEERIREWLTPAGGG